MCLAVPYKVLEINGDSWAEVEAGDIRRQVSLRLFPDVRAGDWVLVNLGFIITKIEEDEAKEIQKLYQELAEAEMLEDASKK